MMRMKLYKMQLLRMWHQLCMANGSVQATNNWIAYTAATNALYAVLLFVVMQVFIALNAELRWTEEKQNDM